jgi:hypothetical protein
LVPPRHGDSDATLSPLRTSNDLPAAITSRLLPPHALAPRVPRRPVGLGFSLDAGDGTRVPLPTFTDVLIVAADTDDFVNAEAPTPVLAEADSVVDGTPTAYGDTTVVYDGLMSPVRLAHSRFNSASTSGADTDMYITAALAKLPGAFNLGAALALSVTPPTL